MFKSQLWFYINLYLVLIFSLNTAFGLVLKEKRSSIYSTTTLANAGKDTSICTSSYNLQANSPSFGETGQWSILSGNGFFSNVNNPTAIVNGLATGENKLLWTISDLSGNQSIDTLVIFNNQLKIVNAGPDKSICADTTSLSGNDPQKELLNSYGTWSLISKPTEAVVLITNNFQYNSKVSGLRFPGNYIFVWEVSNSANTCSKLRDTVVITNNLPKTVNAGIDRTTCLDSIILQGNDPKLEITTSSGTWRIISRPNNTNVSFADARIYNTKVNGLSKPGDYFFAWEIANPSCPSTTIRDTVKITNTQPRIVNAGPDRSICTDSTMLEGNDPKLEFIHNSGTWEIYQAPSTNVTITNPNQFNSKVKGINKPGNYIFIWKVFYNQGTCNIIRDTVVITNNQPRIVNAGIDNTTCNDSITLQGNDPKNEIATSSGTWRIISRPSNTNVSFTDFTKYNTKVNGLSRPGDYLFAWEIVNPSCSSIIIRDTVKITNTQPRIVNAGPDKAICTDSTVLDGNDPKLEFNTFQGKWTIKNPPSPITIADAGKYNTSIKGLTKPGNYVFVWEVFYDQGTCRTIRDTVIISNLQPKIVNAGLDQTICLDSAVVKGNNPQNEISTSIGTWRVIPNPNTINIKILNPQNPETKIKGINKAGVYYFIWEITNKTCPSLRDTLKITNTQLHEINAGVDKIICEESTSVQANNPALQITSAHGFWKLISPPNNSTISIQKSDTPSTNISGFSKPGDYLFLWETSNGLGTCTNLKDSIKITFSKPTVVNAGTDQVTCSDSIELSGNNPKQEISTANGQWKIISNPANTTPTIMGNTDYSTKMKGLTKPGEYKIIWEINNTVGNCPSINDTLIIKNIQPTMVNAGPKDTTTCDFTFTMVANDPRLEIPTAKGQWQKIEGTGAIQNDTLYNSTANLSNDKNKFVWKIYNKNCKPIYDTIIIKKDIPGDAHAGDQFVKDSICDSEIELKANPPVSPGKGKWTRRIGSGTFENDTLYNTIVTDIGYGSNTYIWTVTKGTCVDVGTVKVFRDSLPSHNITAGNPRSICVDFDTLEGTNPTIEISTSKGYWTILKDPSNGNLRLENPNSFKTRIENFTESGVYTFIWNIKNGSCPPIYESVSITKDKNIHFTEKMNDTTICDNSLEMNAPKSLGTGFWKQISGNREVTIADVNDPNTLITNIFPDNIELQWEVRNGTCSNADTIKIIAHPSITKPNAGKDTTLCTTSSIVLKGNTPTAGGGQWRLIEGKSSVLNSLNSNTAVVLQSSGKNSFEWSIFNDYCILRDTVNIFYYEKPSLVNAGIDTIIYDEDGHLNGSNPSPGTGSWSILKGYALIENVNSPNSNFTNLQKGENIFQWTVVNGSCHNESSKVKIERRDFVRPNAFSPNDDLQNDYFEIKGLNRYAPCKIAIYNRWGDLVYESSDYKNDWNGKSKQGKNLEEDTYYYVLHLNDGTEFKDFLILKR